MEFRFYKNIKTRVAYVERGWVESGAGKRQQKPKKRTRASTDAQQTTRNLKYCVLATKKTKHKGEEGRKEARESERASKRARWRTTSTHNNNNYTRERTNERKKEIQFLEKNTAGTKTKIVFLSANKRQEDLQKRKEAPQEKKRKENKQNKTKGKEKMARIFRKKERVL